MNIPTEEERLIAVVILNYNGQHFLAQFLPDVILYSPEAKIYVADNASTDNSIPWLKEHYPEISLILLDKNEGFSRGYNLALQKINAPYYVLLNSDVAVSPNWLSAPLALLKANPLIAACQPKIKSFHNPSYFEYAGAAGGMIDHWAYPFCRGRIFDTLEEDQGQYDSPAEIFWASGAAMFVRSEVYWKAGGLDDDFFAHMEEIDLCWRMQSLGYQIHYVPQSVVYHVGGGTLQSTSPFKTYLNFRNNLAMIFKNTKGVLALLTILLIRTHLDILAMLQMLLSGKHKAAWAVLKANFHFYTRLPRWIHKRNQTIRSPLPRIVYRKSIIVAYFFRKLKKFSVLD